MAAAVVVVDPSRVSGHGHEMVAFRGFGVSVSGEAVVRMQASGYREEVDEAQGEGEWGGGSW
jgi:hypothetical protein